MIAVRYALFLFCFLFSLKAEFCERRAEYLWGLVGGHVREPGTKHYKQTGKKNFLFFERNYRQYNYLQYNFAGDNVNYLPLGRKKVFRPLKIF